MSDTPISPRMLDLLEKAADAYMRNQNPFEVKWLNQHDITIQECVDLSELIGKVLEDFVLDQKEKEGGDAD
jgi:hypothetical protein